MQKEIGTGTVFSIQYSNREPANGGPQTDFDNGGDIREMSHYSFYEYPQQRSSYHNTFDRRQEEEDVTTQSLLRNASEEDTYVVDPFLFPDITVSTEEIGASTNIPSYYFPEDPDAPDWKPIVMSPVYLLGLALISILLGVTQEHLLRVSQRRDGIMRFKSLTTYLSQNTSSGDTFRL
jgi:hypothetical protein